MRVVVLGGLGMLGQAVTAEARRRGYTCTPLGHSQADLLNPEAVLGQLSSHCPEVVINCAALTDVDGCEARQEEALDINGLGVGTLARWANESGSRLVQVSTDFVFDGAARQPYAETAPTSPLSVYGESKRRGEIEALRCQRALVLRTSWLFGPGGKNFVATMARLAGEGRPLRVVDDQVGRPTYTVYLARAIFDLLEAEAFGLWHYGNREPVSWFGLTVAIVAMLGGGVEVEPLTSAELGRPASRPPYSVLDVSRFEAKVGRRVERWQEALNDYLPRIESS